MAYVKCLDGIRGLAISLVLLFHFGYAPFGWIGVQIFFVLSGFLITSILLNEREQTVGRFLAGFYWRRALRIFPLYFAVVLVAWVSFKAFGAPASFPNDIAYLATYTTNFGRLRSSDIGTAFVHLWSLAVEEQFYFLWPIVIYSLSRSSLRVVVLATIVVAPLVRLLVYFVFRDHPDVVGRAIYGLPFTQFDAFAMGAAIALWNLVAYAKAASRFVLTLLVTGVAGLAVLFHEHVFGGGAVIWSLGYRMYLAPVGEFVWGYTLLDSAAALGIVCAIQRLPALRFLESRMLVSLGIISYGVYVFHVPALLLVEAAIRHFNLFLPRAAVFPGFLLVTIGLAVLSFRWLERPFLQLKNAWKSGLLRARAGALPVGRK